MVLHSRGRCGDNIDLSEVMAPKFTALFLLGSKMFKCSGVHCDHQAFVPTDMN